MKRSSALAATILALGTAPLMAQARPAAPPATTPARPAAATVVQVRMQQNGTHYTFTPANLTVKQGDIIEFVNASGFPHNVGFEPTKIPAGAADVLNRSMPNRMGNLQGQMMVTANQAYRVSFAGAPVGTYEFFCLPHKAMGMKGVITVQARR